MAAIAPNVSADTDGVSHSDDNSDDYDHLEIDPDTLMAVTKKSLDDTFEPSGPVGLSQNDQEKDNNTPRPDSTKKRRSVQIRLEKTDEKGRYLIRADDPLIREILRRSVEQEVNEASGRKTKQRFRFRDLVFTKQFTTFDRQNPASSESPFFGFFTLFWLAMVLLFCQVAMRNWRDYGSILGRNQVLNTMFSKDVLILALTDAAMCAGCFEGLLLQKLVHRGYINWSSSGWIIQNLWQTFYLGALVGWTYFREWPWSHTVFAVLHCLVFLMKQHSYNFYNGYLSGVYERRALIEQKLDQLASMEPQDSPRSSNQALVDEIIATGVDTGTAGTISRRPQLASRASTNLATEISAVAGVAAAIEAGVSINQQQMDIFSKIMRSEIDDLTNELAGKSTEAKNAYPNNLTAKNLTEFICFPTLVYELEYPRQDRINWWYVAEKTAATFGVLCVMMVISQGYIYPPVTRTVEMKEAGMSMEERWKEFPFIVSDMLFPLLIEQLLTWYVIWECILNVLAELTRFADRGFYGNWWNSEDFGSYARDWNRPVHNFLLRHVYHSSISAFNLNRDAATFVTFLLSALVHEMVMAVMFKKVRGYLFCMQLLQMPLVMMSRSKFLKGRAVIGNVVFWLGLFVGPSVITSLYLII